MDQRADDVADQDRRVLEWVERERQAMNAWPVDRDYRVWRAEVLGYYGITETKQQLAAPPSPADQARRLLAGTGYVVARDVRPTFDGLDVFCDGWNAACEAMKGDAP